MVIENILNMFGTESTRDNFKNLCALYYGERVRQDAAKVSNVIVSNPMRSEYHNQIMNIVKKLYLNSQRPTPSRDEIGTMIMEYYRNTQPEIEKFNSERVGNANNIRALKVEKLTIDSTFMQDAVLVLRSMIKEGKQEAPLDIVHFPNLSIYIGTPPTDCLKIIIVDVPEDLKESIGDRKVYVVNS